MAKKKEVAIKKSTEVANVDLMQEMAQDSENNSGFEGMNAEDIAIPFISILQAVSPQVKKGEGKIAGAEEGMFFNNVSSECFEGPIKVVPCSYKKVYIEWVSRDAGGGFVAQHTDSEILKLTSKNDKNQDVLGNGNVVVTTAMHFCIMLKEDGSMVPVVISMSSTQLKTSRKWNSQMKTIQLKVGNNIVNPPMYSHLYSVDTVTESNDKGTWSSFSVTNPTLISDATLYKFAKKLHDDVSEGAVKVSAPVQEGADVGAPEVAKDSKFM